VRIASRDSVGNAVKNHDDDDDDDDGHKEEEDVCCSGITSCCDGHRERAPRKRET